jgi:tripartite-type tricarboxylate transporter receptor subunit TctC
VAPHGTPAPIVEKINADLRKALSDPELLKKFQDLGNYTRSMTPQELGEFVRNERQVWGPIVRKVASETK